MHNKTIALLILIALSFSIGTSANEHNKSEYNEEKCKMTDHNEPEFSAVLEPHEFTYRKTPSKTLLIRNDNDWEIASIKFEYSDSSSENLPQDFNGIYEGLFSVKPHSSNFFRFGEAQGKDKLLWDFHVMEQQDYGKATVVEKILKVEVFSKQTSFCIEEYTDDEMIALNEKKLQQEKDRRVANKQKETRQKIYSNCIQDKLPTNSDPDYKKSILSICRRASFEPTFWNKVWYYYFGQ